MCGGCSQLGGRRRPHPWLEDEWGRLGRGEKGEGAPISKVAAGVTGKTGCQGEIKNLEGAFCLVAVFSLAIGSSWGRPEKLGVPPPGSCLGLPSAGSGPGISP